MKITPEVGYNYDGIIYKTEELAKRAKAGAKLRVLLREGSYNPLGRTAITCQDIVTHRVKVMEILGEME